MPDTAAANQFTEQIVFKSLGFDRMISPGLSLVMMSFMLTKKISRHALDSFLQKNKSEGYTLDLGCGDAPYSKYFPNRVGFDIAPGPGVDVVGDAHSLPFSTGQFDVILCSEVLEHLHSPHVAIREMKRVLKPGGTLILTTPFVFPLHEAPYDYFRYTRYGLMHLFKEWEIVELRANLNSQQSLAVLLQRVCYQTTMRANKLSKFFLLLLAQLLYRMPNWITKEYGDIRRETEQRDLFAMGHYLVAKNR